MQLFNVKKADLFSESDPVVIIIVQSTILKTRVVNDDANPVYNERMKIINLCKDKYLFLQIE